jgi:hypothetical protein
LSAQFNLGSCYYSGKGVAAAAAAAVKWFTRAADAGQVDAMNNLAACYEEGTGVAGRLCKGCSLLTRAAEAGNAMAQSNLGMRYLEGSRGVARDVARARECLALAAAGGIAQAADVIAELDAAT